MKNGRRFIPWTLAVFFFWSSLMGLHAQAGTEARLVSPDEHLVALYEEPSRDAPVLACYYPGLTVSCQTDPAQPWVGIAIGHFQGFVPGDSLKPLGEGQEDAPLLPEMVVANRSPGAWLNLRDSPALDAPVLGKYYDGALVTVYGIRPDDEWVHVSTQDGKTGFMAADYLWNHGPITQPYVAERLYERTQRMERGLEARAMVGENFADKTFFTDVFLTFDSTYTTNDDIVGFNLYINEVLTARLEPVADAQRPDAASRGFAAAFAYHGAIDRVHMTAVLENGGENPEETLLLYERPIPEGEKP